jgi:GTP-binding protein YchF
MVNVKTAIVGLSQSGKTTIFDALTKSKAALDTHSASLRPNVGVAKVPDSRLSTLEGIFCPKKTVLAEVSYVDIGGSPRGVGSKGQVGGELLSHLSTADALLQVVRVFEDDRVPHPDGSIDPRRDIATLDLELAFSDLAIIDRRLEKLNAALKGARPAEREAHLKERALLQKVKSALEADVPVRQQELTKDDLKGLSQYQFLSAKPMLVVLNIGEGQLTQASRLEDEVGTAYPQFAVIAQCGKLELELEQLDDSEAEEFRAAMGLSTPAAGRVIDLSYHFLGLISFFTTASHELRAWTVPLGTTASRAAGKVHSDMERGFIRAEVIGYSDMERCGSLNEARKRGLLRMEGKDYLVQDGDIVTFLFNV